MKLFNVFLSIAFITIITSINANIFDDIGDAAKEVVDDIKDVGEQGAACVKFAALKASYETAKLALQTSKKALEATEVVTAKAAFESTKKTLEATKKASVGSLELTKYLAKEATEIFNIECVRFLGSPQNLIFELNAVIGKKNIKISEKVDFKNAEQFVEKIFNKLTAVFS